MLRINLARTSAFFSSIRFICIPFLNIVESKPTHVVNKRMMKFFSTEFTWKKPTREQRRQTTSSLHFDT
jgi:hypothetical protein